MTKKCVDIIKNSDFVEVFGNENVEVNAITADSREVAQNFAYIAVKGTKTDGHTFINNAIDAGARIIVCEIIPDSLKENVTYIKVKNSSYALGIIASNFYDNPSKKLKLVGVTGTNGKTTTVTLLYNLFKGLGYKVGLISTVENIINDEKTDATHTTPDAVNLNKILHKMVYVGCTHCFMEVSSHALTQNRVTGVEFCGASFTNLTHDHLDYHKTFDEYLKAKKIFFDILSNKSFALSNADDKNGSVMLQNTKASKYYYSLGRISDFRGKILENSFNGLLLNFDNIEVWSRLVGKFNAYNLINAYAVAVLLGEDKNKVLTVLSNVKGAEGRFDCVVNTNNVTGIVDYAHTPDALKNVLSTIAEVSDRQGKIITVVGAGGDRDKTKRPLMAEIACNMSNNVILTSDNPRSEDPILIIEDMKKGVDIINRRKVLTIVDRKEAINTACTIAQPGDIVLVAGKGHEKYQDINGVKKHFDDKELLVKFLI